MTRLEKLSDKLKQANIINFLVTKPENLYYLSQFTGDESALLVTPDQVYLITDSRFVAQAHQQLSEQIKVIEHTKGIFSVLNNLLNATTNLGFEAQVMNYVDYQQLKGALPKTELVPTNGIVEEIRQVKDADEIKKIQTAVDISDDCFDHIIHFIKPGMTELSVANEMEYYMRQQGASGVSFETIVASGYRSAWPHGMASNKKIQENELITLDYGCFYQHYASDITRTIALGKVDPELEKIYKIVLAANEAVLKMVKPGVTGGEINATAHNFIEAAGYGKYFGHGTGHSIGLEIHEGPGAFGPYKNQAQVVGNVETDEPGIYLEGKGGARIEDDFLVTETGNELLTKAPKKELIHI